VKEKSNWFTLLLWKDWLPQRKLVKLPFQEQVPLEGLVQQEATLEKEEI